MKGTISVYKFNDKYVLVGSTKQVDMDNIEYFYGNIVSNSRRILELVAHLDVDNEQFSEIIDISNGVDSLDKRYICAIADESGQRSYSIVSKQSIDKELYDSLVCSFCTDTLVCSIDVDNLMESFLNYETVIDDMKSDLDVKVLFGLLKFKNKKYQTFSAEEIDIAFFEQFPYNTLMSYGQTKNNYIQYLIDRGDVLMSDVEESIVLTYNLLELSDKEKIRVSLDGLDMDSTLYYLKKYKIYILRSNDKFRIFKYDGDLRKRIPTGRIFDTFLFDCKIKIETLDNLKLKFNSYLKNNGLPCFLSEIILEFDYGERCVTVRTAKGTYIQSTLEL